MVAKRKNKAKSDNKNWNRLVRNIKKGIEEMEKEKREGKKFPTSAEVFCTPKDIAKSVRGWKREK